VVRHVKQLTEIIQKMDSSLFGQYKLAAKGVAPLPIPLDKVRFCDAGVLYFDGFKAPASRSLNHRKPVSIIGGI